MPRYRIIAPLPEVLEYRTATFRLLEYQGGYTAWVWAAKKEGPGWEAATLIRAGTKEGLADARRDGFNVTAGSPEDKVMQRLVREGVAELMG